MGFEPTTLHDLVGCSNHLSYWRLYGEQGPICGSHHLITHTNIMSRLEPLIASLLIMFFIIVFLLLVDS